METIKEFIKWAKKNRWKITEGNNDPGELPEKIIRRYGIPEGYKKFLEKVTICTNEEESVWFLCMEDYLDEGDDVFSWNEFEKISIEADSVDKELIKGIKGYWGNHLPIVYNIKEEYKYYAIEKGTEKIVSGKEPDYEDSEIIADNFEELLKKIINGEIEL